MPPIFVDGVEIKSLFVDGVEQNTAFADGVQVYSGVPPAPGGIVTAIDTTDEGSLCASGGFVFVLQDTTINKLDADMNLIAGRSSSGGVSSSAVGNNLCTLANGNICLVLEPANDEIYLVVFDINLNIIAETQLSLGNGGAINAGNLRRGYIQPGQGNDVLLGMTIDAWGLAPADDRGGIFCFDENLALRSAVMLSPDSAAAGNIRNGHEFCVSGTSVYARCVDPATATSAWLELDARVLTTVLNTGPVYSGGLDQRSPAATDGVSIFQGNFTQNDAMHRYDVATLTDSGDAIDFSGDTLTLWDAINSSIKWDASSGYLYAIARVRAEQVANAPGTDNQGLLQIAPDFSEVGIFIFESDTHTSSGPKNCIDVTNGELYLGYELEHVDSLWYAQHVQRPFNETAKAVVINGFNQRSQFFPDRARVAFGVEATGAGAPTVTNIAADVTNGLPIVTTWDNAPGVFFPPETFA